MATLIQNPSASSNFSEMFDRYMDDLDVAVASVNSTGFRLGSEPSVVGHNDDSTVLQNSTVLHDSTGLLGLMSPSVQYSFPESRLRVNRSNRYEPLSPVGSQYARSHGSSYQGSVRSENSDTSDPTALEYGFYLFTAGSNGLRFNPALENPLGPLQQGGEWQDGPGAYDNNSVPLFRQESFFGTDMLQGYAPPPPQHFVPAPPQPSQITARQLRLPQHQGRHNKILAYAVSLVNLSTALNGKVLLDAHEVRIYGAKEEALKLDSYNRALFSEGISTVSTLRQSISKKLTSGNRVRRPLMTDASHVVDHHYPYTDPTSANPIDYQVEALKAYGLDWTFMNATEPRRPGQPILFGHDAVAECVVDYLWGRALSMAVEHPQYFIDSPNLWILALVGVTIKHDFYARSCRLRNKKPLPLSGARYADDYKVLYGLILAEWNHATRGTAFKAWWKNVLAFGRRQHALGRARGRAPKADVV